MFNISSFLERYKNIGIKEFLAKEALIKVIKDTTGASLQPKDVVIKHGVVRITSSPAFKSMLFTKKVRIIEEVRRVVDYPITNIL